MLKTCKILILDILLCIFTLTCNAQTYETSIQTRRIGYTTNYGNSFKQPAQVNNDFGTSFNSVNIHRNSIMTGGKVYTPSIMHGGTVYYSTGSSGTRHGGPRRSPQRPYSGNFLEDLADWWRITTDSNWPGYIDDDYWEEFLAAYPEYEDEARAWFESQGKHFPGDQDDPFANPLEDDLLVLNIITGIYFMIH